MLQQSSLQCHAETEARSPLPLKLSSKIAKVLANCGSVTAPCSSLFFKQKMHQPPGTLALGSQRPFPSFEKPGKQTTSPASFSYLEIS
jgi:hypothetical protein